MKRKSPARVTPRSGQAHVRIDDSKEPRFCEVKGRALWALLELDRAGINGITPIEHPAPRWSAYIFNLREIGIKIETVHEPHGGPYPGTHARYILRSSIEICDAFDANA